ncbi:MAG: hypothetical protein M3Y64_08130, partial [Gemmatimonadota bacterium]|nr:hypothetical protein [Gemmatimonadota bacterium]
FSPSGGTVKYDDPATGQRVKFTYSGVGGVVGSTLIRLSEPLKQTIPQGSVICNFFQADDTFSQQLLAKAELDAFGKVTDGIHEGVVDDPTLKAVFQLYMRAYAELELYSRPILTIRYATRDPKSKAGQTIHVDMSNPPCQGDFLIQDVTIDQIHDESTLLAPRYTVVATSVRFELNDLLLQLINQTVIGGMSQAGVVPTATTTAQGNAPQATGVPLLTVAGTLTNAQVIALNTTPITIVAGVTGQILVPVSIYFYSKITVNTGTSAPPNVRWHGTATNLMGGTVNWSTNAETEQVLFPVNYGLAAAAGARLLGLGLDITCAFANSGGSAANVYGYVITYYAITPSV